MLTRMVPRGRIGRLMSFGLVLALTGGCDLSAVSNFSKQSVEAAQYTKLVDDYANAPEREERFQPDSEHNHLEVEAKQTGEERVRLLARLTAVEEYMAALGQLASDKVVDYGTNVDTVDKALVGAKFTDQKEADAIGGIAKILLNAAAAGWRQGQVHNLVEQGNGPIQAVIRAQRDIAEHEFRKMLTNEQTAIESHYDNFMRVPTATTEPVGLEALKELRATELASFPAREKAIDDYVKVLDRISAAHQKLYDQRDHIDDKELLKEIQTAAKDIQTIVKDLKSLR